MFPPRIRVELGLVGQGVMGARFVRCDDGLTYVAKDDPVEHPYIRATEFFWSSVGRQINLPFPVPTILATGSARTVFGTRREKSLATSDLIQNKHIFFSGGVDDGGRQIARLFALDLFCANEDRHADNYLLIQEDHGVVVQGIDFGHSALLPGISNWPAKDPLFHLDCNTRASFPLIIAPYQSDRSHIFETIDRIKGLQLAQIETILNDIPDEWLAMNLRNEIREWWQGDSKTHRLETIRAGILNGTLLNGTNL